MRRLFTFTEPVIGEEGRSGSAQIALTSHDNGDGTTTSTVAAQSDGGARVSMRASQPVDDAVNGRRTSFGTGRVGAFLTALEPIAETDIAVDDDTGFVDKDAVAIFNVSAAGVPTSPELRLINGSPAGNVITLNAGLTAAKYIGARIVKLVAFDTALGIENRPGIRSQLTAPSAVEIAAVDGTDKITVTVTTNDEDEATHYDIYVRETRFRSIEPGWIPDAENQSAATIGAGSVDITTFEGGANNVPDGGGGTVGASTYFVACVAKNGSGRRDLDESRISNVEEVELA